MRGIFVVLAMLAGIWAVPALAATYLGSFSVAGASGPVGSFSATFQITYDPGSELVNDFVPDNFSLTIGSATYTAQNTTFDTYAGALAEGSRDFLFGRFGAGSLDTNNTVSSFDSLPDFRVRFTLDQDNALVLARGAYTLPGTIYDFDTSAGDESSAHFTLLPIVVPEPAVWSLMIVGFGLIGLAARRRATSGSAALA